jgi:hypothetical protein
MNHGPCIVNRISYYTVHAVYAMPETLAERLTLIMELPASRSLDHTLTGQVAGTVIIEIYPEIVQIRGRPTFVLCLRSCLTPAVFLPVCCITASWSAFDLSLPFGMCLCCPRWFHPISLYFFLVSVLALLLYWSVFPFLPAPLVLLAFCVSSPLMSLEVWV